jgi:CHAT domain-containing protein
MSDIQDRGQNTKEGENALALRYIAYEVIQAEARNSRALGKLDEAERLFLEARPFVAEMGLTVGVDFHLAVIACARKDAATAERIIGEIAPAFEAPGVRPRRGALRQIQADLHLLRNEPQQALSAAEDGLLDQATYPDLDQAWKLKWRRARALVATQQFESAVAAYRDCLNDVDRLRMAPLGYRLDTTFLRDKLPMAYEAIDLAVRENDAEAVIWCVELIKSRALSATLSVPRSPASGHTPQEVQFSEISERIDALAFAQYDGTAAPGALQERSRLLAERDDLLEKIRIRDPRWRTVTEPPPVDIDMIRRRLGGERAALVLFYKANQVVAAVIDSAGAACGVRDLTPKTVASITSFAANLRKARPNEYLFDLSKEEEVALEDLLPANVLKRASAAATLIVIPHGILHLLPWACLTIGNERLFERSAVGVLPNLASLPLLDDVPIPDPMVAIIGAADYSGLKKYSPLKESPQEIAEVEGTYQDRVVAAPLTGRDATEATFWELAAEAEGSDPILHFSGHGSLDPSEPLASGLVLTGSTVDAAELLSRRIPYQEVVLSACSTGWRPQTTHGLELSGDDALGIPASFLEAGAQFLLANIPPALETSSRRFTVAWHRQRRSGLSPLQAYRAVQLESYAAAPAGVFSFAGTTAYGCR